MTFNGYKWVYCAEDVVSVAMKIERMGYGLHGHDVNVKLCVCASKKGILDLETLKAILRDVTGSITHRPLWEVTGKDDSLIEDLLIYVRDRVSERLNRDNEGLDVCLVKGITGGGVEVSMTLRSFECD
ncbi:MAG: hypothetical protein GSR85_07660 [Desulfurococcales archaeon]|nr:hypothetical protein [Desulfurococcales archaeon]